jgi:hypothetical protein
MRGGYKCQCRAGYEYPFLDRNDFYPGDQMEKEWFNLISNDTQGSRFYQLKCRIAFANSIKPNLILLNAIIFIVLFARNNIPMKLF